MATEDLLGLLGTNDLLQFNQAVQQGNTYGLAGRSLDAWQPDYSTFSPVASGATSFGKSFLAGLLQNYARQDAAEQIASVANVLPSLKSDPYHTAVPEGVDSGAFNLLRGSAILKKAQRDSLTGDENTKNLSSLLQTVLGEGVKSGTISPSDALKAAKTGDYSAVLGGSVDPLANPNSPQYKMDKDKEDRLITIRKEFNGLPAVQNFSKASQAANALSGALKDKSKVSDQELVRYSILMIEPGMAVREGEAAAVASSQSLPQAWKNALSSALEGKTNLGEDVREGIKNLASRAYDSHKSLYDQANELYSKEATLQGLDPSRLSYIGSAPTAEGIFGKSILDSTKDILTKPPTSQSEVKAALGKILAEMNNPATSFERKLELKKLANSLVTGPPTMPGSTTPKG